MAWNNAAAKQNEGCAPQAPLSGQESIQPTQNSLSGSQMCGGLDRRAKLVDSFYGCIIGKSNALNQVMELVRTVGPTESTALIEGETGTGKELIAGAIHEHSPRRNRSFVKLNCSAIPVGLIESELFGHERGAFTGAFTRKLGRFEVADRGTLFLDEIGDLPLEVQTKLLRVLQEQEFERLGSAVTQRVNVRLIAATNCNLAFMVRDKRFRSDLYYRLNVFPIAVPALRDRPEDIAPLVAHFVETFGRSMKKNILEVPQEAMRAMEEYSWPGNIRELRNFIERSVILTQGPILRAPLKHLVSPPKMTVGNPVTLKDAERAHICRTLEETRGVVAGPRGAAARLGIKRSTLYFRMRKLGIVLPHRSHFTDRASGNDSEASALVKAGPMKLLSA